MKPKNLSRRKVQELYERFGPAIYSRCRRLLRDPVAAEDATQEVFLRVLKHIDSMPGDPAALAWVYRISTNYCLNLIRDGQRRGEPVDVVPEQQVIDFEGSVLSKDFASRLMGDAPPELRTPVVLYHMKGMEQSQIARALGVSRRTVLYRLGEFAERARRFAARADAGLA